MTTPTQAQIEATANLVQTIDDRLTEIIEGKFAHLLAGRQKDLAQYIQTIGRSIEANTVERCAQVAENFNAAGKPIAAAIRNLKKA